MLINDTSFIKLPEFIKGKVRNVYDLGDKLLIVVTDRISAFDVVFPNLIPHKGKVLNSISEYWFDYTKDIVGNHMITSDVDQYPEGLSKFKEELQGRSMLVKKIKMAEVECIVRGYLEGSGLKEYKKSGAISGVALPKGLKQGDKLPEAIFTPSTKALEGHDELITYDELKNIAGQEMAQKLKDTSLALYNKASVKAGEAGLILADTKFEFGLLDGDLVVADEMFTPDSSRYWELADYKPGGPQKSFDKQYLRDWLEKSDWDKTPPAPELPSEVVEKTSAKYVEAYERITGKKFNL